MTLVEFLRARYDEDEQKARATAPPPATSADLVWKARDKSPADQGWCVYAPNAGIVDDLREEDARHIARHDPARVLREVEAKRKVVDLHGHDPHECVFWDEALGETCTGYDLECPTLRLLALPYADHPDYLPEWRP